MKFLPIVFIILITSQALGANSDNYGIYNRGRNKEKAPNLPQINSFIDSIPSTFKKDTIKAIFWLESNWSMEDSPDIGIGQINEPITKKFYPGVNIKRLKTDWQYNICVSIVMLEDKLEWVKWRKKKSDWGLFCAKYGVQDLTDAELAILAYNGVRKNHAYLNLVKKYKKTRPWRSEQ